VATWLNGRHKHKPFVLQLVSDLSTVLGELGKYKSAEEFWANEPLITPEFWECYKRMNTKTLRMYPETPWIEPTVYYNEGRVLGARSEQEPPAEEQVLQILDLVRFDRLNNLRRCKLGACKKWYFARFAHQEFCCEKCRTKSQSSAASFKARRREYMREYYRLKKSGKVK